MKHSIRWGLLVPAILAVTFTPAAAAVPADLDDQHPSAQEVIQERYPNRSIKIERQVTQDADGNYINHGTWKMWDERQNLVAEGEYRHDLRHGLWTRYHAPGQGDLFTKAPFNQFTAPFVSRATFQDGKLHGVWTITDSKNRKLLEIELADGLRDGKSVFYYPSGRKKLEIDYRKGLPDGELIDYDPEGKILARNVYLEGRKLAPKVEFHNPGQKKSEAMYLHARVVLETADDWWEAKFATYGVHGKDQRHGAYTAWFPSGHKQLQGQYENDVRVGRFVQWHPNGQVAAEGEFDAGQRQGLWTWWHENGQKAVQGQYEHGTPQGVWMWWNDDGKVARRNDYSAPKSETLVELPEDRAEALRLEVTPKPLHP